MTPIKQLASKYVNIHEQKLVPTGNVDHWSWRVVCLFCETEKGEGKTWKMT